MSADLAVVIGGVGGGATAGILIRFSSGNVQDFADSSLGVDNKGFQMLLGLGWEEGAGLGAKGTRMANVDAVVCTSNDGHSPYDLCGH